MKQKIASILSNKIYYINSNFVNYGLSGVLKCVAFKLSSKPNYKRRNHTAGDSFDEAYGVETNRIIEKEDSDIDKEQIKNAEPHVPTEPNICLKALQGARTNPEKFSFIDIGSGLGRVLILAASIGFKKVIGIELSEELNKSAIENLINYSKAHNPTLDTDLINISVLDFKFPDVPLCIYIYKPFSNTIYVEFLRNLEAKILNNPTNPVILISVMPYELSLIEKNAPSLKLIRNIEVDEAYHCWQVFKTI